MKNHILSALLLVLLTGCCCSLESGSEQVSTLIFQSEYTNYAWGYNHNGWMMGNSGVVKRFQKKAAWVFPDAQGFISEADMMKNLAACDSIIAKVTPGDFSKYASMAMTCADGPLSKAENKMADAGENIWAFYTYDSGSKRYQRVILDMTGDWSQQNLAPNAKEVADFLKNIK
jgi:hypothetical protein